MADPSFEEELQELTEICQFLRSQLNDVSDRLRQLEQDLKQSEAQTPPAPMPTGLTPPPVVQISPPQPPAVEDDSLLRLLGRGAEPAPMPDLPPPAEPYVAPTPQRPTTGPRIEPPSSPRDLGRKPAAAPPPPADRPLRENVELILGRTWLNRIGAVVLLLAAAFFVKYSFDQGWIGPTTRVLLAAAMGVLLAAGGEFSLHRGMRAFAAGLIGCGVGILYVATYAAQNFYGLIDTQAASVLYSLVTLLSIATSVHGNLLPVAVLAIIGGFGTPIALSTGVDRQVALLTYVLVLDLGFLISAAIRKWDILRVLSWAGTAALFGGWYLEFYRDSAMWRTAGFVLAFYLLFHGAALLSLWRGSIQWPRVVATLIHVNNAAFFASIYFLVRDAVPQWMGLFTVATAAFLWLAAWRLRGEEAVVSPARESLWLDGAAILALAAPIQFDRYLVSVTWAIQAAVTFAFCRRIPRAFLRAKGISILVAAVIHLWLYDRTDEALAGHFWIVGQWFADRLLLCMVLVSLCAYLGGAVLAVRRKATFDDLALSAALLGIGTVQLLATFADHWERYIATWWWLGLALCWWLLARKTRWALVISLLLLAATAVKYFFYDTIGAAADTAWAKLNGMVLNRAVVSGVLVAALAVWMRLGLEYLPPKITEMLEAGQRSTLTILACLLITWTGTFEILRVFNFEAWAQRTFAVPHDARGVFITGFWAINAAALWLLVRHRNLTLASYTLILTMVAIGKMMLLDTLVFALDGPWHELSGLCSNRVFLIGLLVIGTGLIGHGTIRHLPVTQGPSPIGAPAIRSLVLVLLLVLITWIPTFELVRAFHYEPLRLRFENPRLAMHVALSVFWAANATTLLVIGFARWTPLLRYYALFLFAVTVVKIFVFDLAQQAMIYRIVSFAVLGLLLLFASLLYQRVTEKFASPKPTAEATDQRPGPHESNGAEDFPV